MFNNLEKNSRFFLTRKFIIIFFIFSIVLLPNELYAQTCTGSVASGFATDFEVGDGAADLTETNASDCCFVEEENQNCDGTLINATPAPGDTLVPRRYHFVSGTICLMQTVMVGSMFNVYCGLLDSWGNVLRAAVTLYIIFYAIALVFKINNTQLRHGTSKAIKLAIIITFLQNPDLAYTLFYQGFLAFLDGVSVELTCVAGNAGSACSAADRSALLGGTGGIFNQTDTLFAAIVGKAYLYTILILSGVLVLTGFGIGIAFFLMTGLFVALKAFIDVLRSFIVSFLSITFLMIFAPIFVTALLFSPTTKFFVTWMSSLISYTIQPIVILVFLFLMSNVTSVRTLIDNITDVTEAAGLLRKCELNPYVDPDNPLGPGTYDPSLVRPEDKYGLWDDSGIKIASPDRFYIMKVYYPDMATPPACIGPDFGTADAPCYFDCDSSATALPVECWTLSSDGNDQIKFDLPGSSFQEADLDNDASTPDQRVECGLWYLQFPFAYFFGNWAFPVPQFRDPPLGRPTTMNFYGYGEPSSLQPIVGVNADGDNLYDYTLSFVTALKIIFAIVIAWFITSSLMSAFVTKVPDFARQLIQYQGSTGSAVIIGPSALFSDIAAPNRSASTEAEIRNQGLLPTRGNRSSVYMLGGSASSPFNAARAVGNSITRVLSIIPGAGAIIDQHQTSLSNQSKLAQTKASNFFQGGGLIGMMMRGKNAKNLERSIRRRGIDNNPLLAAEMATAGTSLGTNFGINKNKDDDDDPSGGGGGGSAPSGGGGNLSGKGRVGGGSGNLSGKGRVGGGVRPASSIEKATALAEFEAKKLQEEEREKEEKTKLEEEKASRRGVEERKTKEANKEVSISELVLPQTKTELALDALSLALTATAVGAPVGVGLKAYRMAKVAKRVNKVRKVSKAAKASGTASKAAKYNQKRTSTLKILKTARKIKEANALNKDQNKGNLPKTTNIPLNKTKMFTTFSKGMVSGVGFAGSVKASVNRGLQDAAQTARARGDTASLNEIHKMRTKISKRAENYNKSVAAKEDSAFTKMDLEKEKEILSNVKRKSRNRFESQAIKELAKQGKTTTDIIAAKEKKEDRRFQKGDFKDLEDSVHGDKSVQGRKESKFGVQKLGDLGDEFAEERKIKQAEKDGKTIEEARSESIARQADRDFINKGRTSAESKYRKEQIETANRRKDLGYDAKSYDEITKDFEATDEGRKVVKKDNKETYRDLLENTVNYEDRRRILEMRANGVNAADATEETRLFREEQKFIEDSRIASSSSLSSSDALRLAAPELLALKSAERKFREEKVALRRRRRSLGYETESLDEIKKDFEENTTKGRQLAGMEMFNDSELGSEKAIIREGMKKGMNRDEINSLIAEKEEAKELKWEKAETKDIEKQYKKNKEEIDNLRVEFKNLNISDKRGKEDEKSFEDQLSEEARTQYQIIKNGYGKEDIIKQELKDRREIRDEIEKYATSTKYTGASYLAKKAFGEENVQGVKGKFSSLLSDDDDIKGRSQEIIDDEPDNFMEIEAYRKEQARRKKELEDEENEKNDKK